MGSDLFQHCYRYTNDGFHVGDQDEVLGSIASYGNVDEDFDSLEENKEPKPIATDKSDKEKGKSYHSYVLVSKVYIYSLQKKKLGLSYAKLRIEFA